MPPKPAKAGAKGTKPAHADPIQEADSNADPMQKLDFVVVADAAIKTRGEVSYKQLYEALAARYVALRDKLDSSMQESYEVTEHLRSELAKTKSLYEELKGSVDGRQAAWNAERTSLLEQLAKKEAMVRAELEGKENELKHNIASQAQQIKALERFRDAQEEVERELQAARKMANDVRSGQEAREAELERKYIEQGAKLKKDFEARLDEARRTAQASLEERLDVTARHTLLQNRRLAEELRTHVQETDSLQRSFQTLQDDRRDLRREVDLKGALERQYAARGGRLVKEVKEGNRKLGNMERTLEALLRESEDEKAELRQRAAEEGAQAVAEAEDLRRALAVKDKELLQLRRLGREVLSQRTDTERFLIDSLNLVRREAAAEAREARTVLPLVSGPSGQSVSAQSAARGWSGMGLGPPSRATGGGMRSSGSQPGSSGSALPLRLGGGGGGTGGSARGESQSFTLGAHQPPLSLEASRGGRVAPAGSMDIGDLSWEDRERVLRLVFSKINERAADGDRQEQPARR